MARCPSCKKELVGYNWTKTKNNKNWLQDKSGQWHDCPNAKKWIGGDKKTGTWVFYSFKPEDFEFCEFCGCQPYKEHTFEKYPALFGLTLEEHIEQYHPNGEILDDIDFKVITDEAKENMRVRCNKPKINKKYYLQNNILLQEK